MTWELYGESKKHFNGFFQAILVNFFIPEKCPGYSRNEILIDPRRVHFREFFRIPFADIFACMFNSAATQKKSLNQVLSKINA